MVRKYFNKRVKRDRRNIRRRRAPALNNSSSSAHSITNIAMMATSTTEKKLELSRKRLSRPSNQDSVSHYVTDDDESIDLSEYEEDQCNEFLFKIDVVEM
ncbi:unnamed protein product [Rotaria socialis]|uniref:Uncharacterized protein n=1 Tax=Rotaria socialis TaxID=392032 RepID=A0A819AYA8_9BILA|nr:unnamed protein product [Rotaria socialis]